MASRRSWLAAGRLLRCAWGGMKIENVGSSRRCKLKRLRKNSFASPNGRRKRLPHQTKSLTSRLGGTGGFACQRLFPQLLKGVRTGPSARFLTVAARERGTRLFSVGRGRLWMGRRQVGNLPHWA
jgi:hypothetical protein